jgi:Fur family transcriptional regulator, ferric uptake regulator
MTTTLLEQALKQHQVSITKPRKQLYDILSHSEPLTMQELLATLPELDKTTIYRAVALFEKIGIIQRLQIGFTYKLELSNEFQEHHHHLTCIRCERTFALPEDDLVESRLTELARAQGFEPQDHQLEIRGLCQECAIQTT